MAQRDLEKFTINQPVANAAALAAVSTVGRQTGSLVYQIDIQQWQVWNGSAWVQKPDIISELAGAQDAGTITANTKMGIIGSDLEYKQIGDLQNVFTTPSALPLGTAVGTNVVLMETTGGNLEHLPISEFVTTAGPLHYFDAIVDGAGSGEDVYTTFAAALSAGKKTILQKGATTETSNPTLTQDTYISVAVGVTQSWGAFQIDLATFNLTVDGVTNGECRWEYTPTAASNDFCINGTVGKFLTMNNITWSNESSGFDDTSLCTTCGINSRGSYFGSSSGTDSCVTITLSNSGSRFEDVTIGAVSTATETAFNVIDTKITRLNITTPTSLNVTGNIASIGTGCDVGDIIYTSLGSNTLAIASGANSIRNKNSGNFDVEIHARDTAFGPIVCDELSITSGLSIITFNGGYVDSLAMTASSNKMTFSGITFGSASVFDGTGTKVIGCTFEDTLTTNAGSTGRIVGCSSVNAVTLNGTYYRYANDATIGNEPIHSGNTVYDAIVGTGYEYETLTEAVAAGSQYIAVVATTTETASVVVGAGRLFYVDFFFPWSTDYTIDANNAIGIMMRGQPGSEITFNLLTADDCIQAPNGIPELYENLDVINTSVDNCPFPNGKLGDKQMSNIRYSYSGKNQAFSCGGEFAQCNNISVVCTDATGGSMLNINNGAQANQIYLSGDVADLTVLATIGIDCVVSSVYHENTQPATTFTVEVYGTLKDASFESGTGGFGNTDISILNDNAVLDNVVSRTGGDITPGSYNNLTFNNVQGFGLGQDWTIDGDNFCMSNCRLASPDLKLSGNLCRVSNNDLTDGSVGGVQTITLEASSKNAVVIGNIVNAAVSDSGTNNTVANNPVAVV